MRLAGSNFENTEDPDCSEIVDFEYETEELLQYEHMIKNDVQQTVELPNHFRCASHTLNLIATRDALKAIQKDIFLSVKHDQAITSTMGKYDISEIVWDIEGCRSRTIEARCCTMEFIVRRTETNYESKSRYS